MSQNNSEELESALLGSLIVNKGSFERVRGLITSDDFFNPKHKIVFQAIEDIVENGFTVERAPLIKRISDDKNLEKIGGIDYIDLLMAEAGLQSNIQKFVEKIVEESRMREVVAEIKAIQDDINKKNLSADEILQQVEMNIISNTRDVKLTQFKTAKEIVKEVLHEIEMKLNGKMISGIPTEFKDLDEITGGLHRGDLIILAARPSMGKTAFALNLAANIAKKKSVAIFSIEMPSKQLISRVIGSLGYLPSSMIQRPELMSESQKRKFSIATDKIEKLNLHIDDSPGIKLGELVWKAKRLKKNKGLDVIVIDYLQLITTAANGENRQAEVSAISRTLKKLARELEVPIIALSQLSRKVEQRDKKVPMMSDIRESGAIEQDADLIAFLYREAYYKEKDAKDNGGPQTTDLIISKHRNGATGVVKMSFVPEYGLFMDKVKGEEDE